MRRIGRFRSEASPSKRAVIAWPPDDAHHQAHAGAGIAEVEGFARREQASRSRSPGRASAPPPRRSTSAPSAAAGGGGAQNVVAFEQALDLGLAHAEETENQGAVRDRLVARRLHPAAQRPARPRAREPALVPPVKPPRRSTRA